MPKKQTKLKPWRKKMWAFVTTEGYITCATSGRPHIYEKQLVPISKMDGADRVVPVIVTITEAPKGRKK